VSSSSQKPELIATTDDRARPNFIPANRYNAPELGALEKERLWPKIWHIVCREEELVEVGDFVTYEICDESIVVTRSTPDQVRAFYNVCQHRGRRLVEKPSGRMQRFHCRFHGWQYSLEGDLTQVFAREDWDACGGLDEKKLCLPQLRVENWGGWVWINMDPDAEPLLDWLGETVVSTFAPYDLPSMRRAFHEVLIAPVNWKIVVEAFNEGYHSAATHNRWFEYGAMSAPSSVVGNHSMFNTFMTSANPKAKRENGEWREVQSLQEMIYYQLKELHDTLNALVAPPAMQAVTRLRDETPADMPPEQIFARLWELNKEELEKTGATWPQDLRPEHLGAAGVLWHLFPNTVFLPSVDGVLWYRMRPNGDDPHSCIFDIWTLRRYPAGQEPAIETHISDGFEAFTGRNAFLEQDFSNMKAVDRGTLSRGWRGAETNPVQEVAIVHFHRMMDRFLGQDQA